MSTDFDTIFKTALCSCSLEIEDTSHYLLRCHHYSHYGVVLMNSIKSIYDNFESVPNSVKEDLLLYGDHDLMKTKTKLV